MNLSSWTKDWDPAYEDFRTKNNVLKLCERKFWLRKNRIKSKLTVGGQSILFIYQFGKLTTQINNDWKSKLGSRIG